MLNLLLGVLLLSFCLKFVLPLIVFYLKKGPYRSIPQHPIFLAQYKVLDTRTGSNAFEEMMDAVRIDVGDVNSPYETVVYIGNVLNHHTVWLSDAEAMKAVLNDPVAFNKEEEIYAMIAELTGKTGLIATMTNENWRIHRKLITPLFHLNGLREMFYDVRENSYNFSEGLRMRSGEFVNASQFFSRLTLTAVIKLNFGDDLDVDWMVQNWSIAEKAFSTYIAGRALVGKAWNYLPIKSGKGFMEIMGKIRNQIEGAIQRRVQQLKTKEYDSNAQNLDLIGLLIQTESEGKQLSYDEIIDECLTFLFAGHGTTSSALQWVMYHLATMPKIQEKLREEIHTKFGKEKPESYNDLGNLDYLKNVIKESLRIKPTVYVTTRILSNDMVVDDKHHLPAGTLLYLNFYHLHNNPKYWKAPHEFNPDRWVTDEIVPYSYVPFSAGSRGCIGRKLAELEMQLTIFFLVQNYKITLDESQIITNIQETVSIPKNLFLKFDPIH